VTSAFVHDLRACLAAHANPQRAAGMAAYMKHRFPFFGIATAERRALLKAFLAERPIPVSDQTGSGLRSNRVASENKPLLDVAAALWREPERELHYCALDLLERHAKSLGPEDFPRLESLVTSQSWWDSVDVLAPKVMGAILARHPEWLPEKIGEWLDSGDLWLQRTALLCQMKWKARTDVEQLARAIEATSESSEFFLRKAIGWALREYAKTDPDWVRDFVDRAALSGLSRREALKHLTPSGRAPTP
jgi:3-methyladenine DNA glycosylase AlkD